MSLLQDTRHRSTGPGVAATKSPFARQSVAFGSLRLLHFRLARSMRPARCDSYRGCSMLRLPTTLVLTLFALSFATASAPTAGQQPRSSSSSGAFRAFASSVPTGHRGDDVNWRPRSAPLRQWQRHDVARRVPFGRFASHRAYVGPVDYGIPFVPTGLAAPIYGHRGAVFFLTSAFIPQFAFGLGYDVAFAFRVSSTFDRYGAYLAGVHDSWSWRFAGIDRRRWYRDRYRDGYRDGYADAYWYRNAGRYPGYVSDPWRPSVGRTGSRGFWDAEQDWQRLRPRWGAESGRPVTRREPSRSRPRTARPARPEPSPSPPQAQAPPRPRQGAARPRQQPRPYLRPAPGGSGSPRRPEATGPERRPQRARPRDTKTGVGAPRQGASGQGRAAVARPRNRPR